VPAFYGDWFMNRLKAGYACWCNPIGGKPYVVSLKREDVAAFVFWSKNYRPFLPALQQIGNLGYPAVFNYTITGLPRIFEPSVVDTDDAIDSFKTVSRLYTPEHIAWRYDPIIISGQTNADYHANRFTELAGKLEGHTTRCHFSYTVMHGKVKRRLAALERDQATGIRNPGRDEQIELAQRLAAIAMEHGIQLCTCCGDHLLSNEIQKSHCVDGELVSRLYYDGSWKGTCKPTRKQCGCTASIDIGAYDTCPHGCIYCYATTNSGRAEKAFHQHDKISAFLGYSRTESDKLITALAVNRPAK
jgi:hypothetical protein